MSWALVAGAGVGLAKGISGQAKESRDRKLAAATQRLSPWTGLKADAVKDNDMLGSVVQGGLSGYQVGQGVQQNDLNNSLMKKLIGGFDVKDAAKDLQGGGLGTGMSINTTGPQSPYSMA